MALYDVRKHGSKRLDDIEDTVKEGNRIRRSVERQKLPKAPRFKNTPTAKISSSSAPSETTRTSKFRKGNI